MLFLYRPAALVQVLTTLPAAAVQVALLSTGYGGVTYAQSSLSLPFTKENPSVYSVGGTTSSIATTGGSASSPLILQVANLGNAASVEVNVGGAVCPLLQLNNGACTQNYVATTSTYPTLAAAVTEVKNERRPQAS